MCFRGALWSMCSGWLGLITGGQFELGISVLNRHRDGGASGGEGRGGSGVHRPPSHWNKGTFVRGAHYCMHFTLGYQIPDVATVIIQLNLWHQFLIWMSKYAIISTQIIHCLGSPLFYCETWIFLYICKKKKKKGNKRKYLNTEYFTPVVC